MPVAVTTSSPEPRVALVFMWAMSTRSPNGVSAAATGSTSFGTGALSPVSADSSISSVAALMIRPSAGIRSPASTATMSPGTSSSAGICSSDPSRRTRVCTIIIFWSAATLDSALPSWLRDMTALSRVSPRSMIAVPRSRMTMRLTSAAPSSTNCIGSWYWRTNLLQPDSFFASANLLGPNFARRDSTSALLRPTASSTFCAFSASGTDRVCHAVCGASCPAVDWVVIAYSSQCRWVREVIGTALRPRVPARRARPAAAAPATRTAARCHSRRARSRARP